MIKKLIVLAVMFAVLCFAGVGCFSHGTHHGVHENVYYDGPYRIGGGNYYYYNGGFYVYDGRAYRFHHNVPQQERGYYEERHRENHEHYKRDYKDWRGQHPEHPDASRRD